VGGGDNSLGMPRTCLSALVAVAALATVVPVAAHADRPPTKRERAGIANKVEVPARCLKIRVSTVNTRWAKMRLRNLRKSCQRWAADGVAVYKRRKDGGWRFVTAGSAFDCPVPKVPPRVVTDLHIRCYDQPG
jgi:hypothetical protein